jgi:hypothetical protein
LPLGSSILAILLALLFPDRARVRETVVEFPALAEEIYAREAR